jgi:SAM-dependent methyltransferase
MEQPEYEWMYDAEDWHWWFVSRRRMTATLLDQHLTPDINQRILDVGCGTGANLEFLARWGRSCGLDLSVLALNFACRRPSLRLTRGSGLILPYPDRAFALVTSFDVLYHRWVDDIQALAEFYRVLESGGWLLLTNPALPALRSTHDDIYYTRQRYTIEDTRQKVAAAGFQVYTCSYIYLLMLPLFTAVRLMSRWWPSFSHADRGALPAWLNRWLIGWLDLEVMWLRQGHTLPVGSSLICLAQKQDKGREGSVYETS